jgi:hypothetical protein
MGGRRARAAHFLMEDNGPRYRLEDMSDDERTPDDAELDQTEDAADEDDDVEAHSLPLPPPRPMNGL